MISLKKILPLLLMILLLTACGESNARMATENYLKQYKTLDSEVLIDLESQVYIKLKMMLPYI